MRKTIRRELAVIFACMMLFSGSVVSASAAQGGEETAEPRYALPISVDGSVGISDTLELTTVARYTAAASQMSRVDITTYVEKRKLLVVWNRVDIGQPNNEWTDTCYGAYNTVFHAVQLPASGTYRVTFVFEVYNGSTLVETIEETTDKISC